MKKKYFTPILFFSVVFGVVGCQKNNQEESKNKVTHELMAVSCSNNKRYLLDVRGFVRANKEYRITQRQSDGWQEKTVWDYGTNRRELTKKTFHIREAYFDFVETSFAKPEVFVAREKYLLEKYIKFPEKYLFEETNDCEINSVSKDELKATCKYSVKNFKQDRNGIDDTPYDKERTLSYSTVFEITYRIKDDEIDVVSVLENGYKLKFTDPFLKGLKKYYNITKEVQGNKIITTSVLKVKDGDYGSDIVTKRPEKELYDVLQKDDETCEYLILN